MIVVDIDRSVRAVLDPMVPALGQPHKPPTPNLYQNLSYGEFFAGQPGAWLVKQYVLYACNHKITKVPHIEIQNNFLDMSCFYDVNVCYGGTCP